MRFFALHNGWASGSGSGSVTSSPANILPELSSEARASVSTMGPRPTFTRTAPSFIFARRSLLKRCFDSAFSGRTRKTISSCGRWASRSTIFTDPSEPEREKNVISTSYGAR